MTICIACRHCRGALHVQDHLAGCKRKCPRCVGLIRLPVRFSGAAPAKPTSALSFSRLYRTLHNLEWQREPAVPDSWSKSRFDGRVSCRVGYETSRSLGNAQPTSGGTRCGSFRHGGRCHGLCDRAGLWRTGLTTNFGKYVRLAMAGRRRTGRSGGAGRQYRYVVGGLSCSKRPPSDDDHYRKLEHDKHRSFPDRAVPQLNESRAGLIRIPTLSMLRGNVPDPAMPSFSTGGASSGSGVQRTLRPNAMLASGIKDVNLNL